VSTPGKMWGGRFTGEPDPVFAAFQNSLRIDHHLAEADLEVNRTWSHALVAASVLTAAEQQQIEAAIDATARQWSEHGVPTDGAEDVHSLVEQTLGRHCGDLALKIHTGRSRNDQVATDLKLWLRERTFACVEGLRAVARALVAIAEQHAALPMPGYTHLQRAQPITVGHWALAHAEALARDRTRLLDGWRRMDTCPLGSGALAGTALRIDREAIATELGFLGPTRNSLDATSARDHACETAFCCASTMASLSRLCEDLVFFASREAGFVRFGDAASTGSSLMPQKRNPDAMELIRGRAGRIFGYLQALLVQQKGLPMAYNRDLQEDKLALFPCLWDTEESLQVMAIALADVTFDAGRCRQQAELGYQNATDLADLLVAAGVPFRSAHAQVGAAVNRAIELGVELQDLPPAERNRLLPQLSGDLAERLSAAAVLARRDVLGGTAPLRVAAEVRRWQQELQRWAPDAAPEEP